VDGQGRRLDQGQHRDSDHGGRHIFRGVAEGADRLGQLRHAAVAQGDLVALALAHDQQRQHQQQNQMQTDPQRRSVAGCDGAHVR
jgi:hypothetical protein